MEEEEKLGSINGKHGKRIQPRLCDLKLSLRVLVYKYYDKVRLTKKNSTDDKEVGTNSSYTDHYILL